MSSLLFIALNWCLTLKERFSIMSFKGNAAMDGGSKKEKMVNLVWRPISTRSSSVVYSGYTLAVWSFNSFFFIYILHGFSHVETEAAEGQCSKPSGVSERAPVVSAGKHSVPLEVLMFPVTSFVLNWFCLDFVWLVCRLGLLWWSSSKGKSKSYVLLIIYTCGSLL